jgi:hypothetical protein
MPIIQDPPYELVLSYSTQLVKAIEFCAPPTTHLSIPINCSKIVWGYQQNLSCTKKPIISHPLLHLHFPAVKENQAKLVNHLHLNPTPQSGLKATEYESLCCVFRLAYLSISLGGLQTRR